MKKQQPGGHSTPEFTAAVYTHLLDEEKVADASRRAGAQG
jgi:hypothetical protein